MNRFAVLVIVILVIAGGIYALRGGGSKKLGQGVPDGAAPTDIAEIKAHGDAWKGREVTVRGEMTEKCPTTGCWFYLKDSTGQIRVDTAPSGFTVTEIPLHRTVTVHGKVVTTEAGDVELVATGVKG
jgi:uncharacterized protein YdeI (BOF family)